MKTTIRISLCLMIVSFAADCKDAVGRSRINPKKKLFNKSSCLIKDQIFLPKYPFLSINNADDPSKKDKTKGRRSYTITPTNPYFT